MLTDMIGNTTHATVKVHQENLTKVFTSKKSDRKITEIHRGANNFHRFLHR